MIINKGFTLIEILIAISVVIIGIAAVASLFPIGLKIERSITASTIANQLAQEKIEEIISKSYDEVLCNSASLPCEEIEESVNDYPYFQRTLQILYADPQNDLNEPQPPDEDTGIKKIKVAVSWQGGEVEFVTLISKR